MKLTIVFLSLFLTFLGKAQNNNELESIKNQINSIDFGKKYDSLLQVYCNKVYAAKNQSGIAFCLRSNAFNLMNLGKRDAALEKIDTAITQYKTLHDNDGLAIAYSIKARIYNNADINDSSTLYFEKALEYAKTDKALFSIYFTYVKLLIDKNDFSSASDLLEKAMVIAKKNNNPLETAFVLYELGHIQFLSKNYEKALKLLYESLDLFKNNKAKTINIADNIFLLANTNRNLKNENTALQLYQESLNLYRKTNSYDNVGLCYSNLGASFTKLKKYKKANAYLDSAIHIFTETKSIQSLVSTYNRKAILALDIKDKHQAIQFIEKALELSIENRFIKSIYSMYYNLAYLQHDTGNNQKAYELLVKAYNYKDTLLKANYYEKIAEIEAKYETEKKENEILQLTNDNNQKKAALSQSRLMNVSGAAILILMLGLGYFIWHKKRQQQKLQLLQTKIKSTEDEKNRIAKELHDGIAGNMIMLANEIEPKEKHIATKLMKSYNEIRDLSHALSNTPTHSELLIERLLDILPENKQDKIFNLNIEPLHLIVDEPYASHIYRILQELITNNIKYAQATETNITISLNKNVLTILYTDNGIGNENLNKGMGFSNIEDRVKIMQGNMEITSTDNVHFSIQITIPYNNT